ncbi:MAG: PAS domain-containing protein [Marivibrio sp.]|uniref:sensor histidine kinase n=1 Tax=Marivibrio sp. TaxID=2039719 RepID=UPI0032EE2D13
MAEPSAPEQMSREALVAEVRRLRAESADAASSAARPLDWPSILHDAPMPISLKGADQRFRYMNAAMAALFRCTPEEAVGRTAHELVPEREAAPIAARDALVLETGETSALYEESLGQDHANYAWARSIKAPVREADGRISGVLTLSTINPAQAEHGAQLASLIESAPFPVYFKDRLARFTIANEELLRNYGLTRLEQAVGKRSAELFAEEGETYTAEDLHVLKTREIFTREITLGDHAHMIVKFPVIDRQGRLLGLGGIEPNITQKARYEEALRQAKEEAEQASRAKSQFLATISHELRTPLNAIIGFAEVVTDAQALGIDPGRLSGYGADIARSGRMLKALIDDILDLSAVEAGKLSLERERLDLRAVVQQALGVMRPEPSERVDLQIDLGALPLMVNADARRLTQVAINLISNALKYTSEGRIRVSGRRVDGRVEVAVSDTGPGMGPHDLEAVMREPFRRAESPFVRRTEGVGLGLWLSRRIMEAHDGGLRVESVEGEGLTATLFAPFAEG